MSSTGRTRRASYCLEAILRLTMPPPDPASFRTAMTALPTGVTVVAAAGAEGPAGATANAVCSLSIEPMLMLACLDRGSRTLLAVQAAGSEVATVEGLAGPEPERPLHPLQEAFRRHFALQCGFCTAGILMTAAERLDDLPTAGAPTELEARQLLSGHLCRCTGYEPILAALAEAATAMTPTEGLLRP